LCWQVERLKAVKQEYKYYLSTMRTEEQDDDKSDDTTFMVVNREPEYLRDSALSFARNYQLEDAIGSMYQVDDAPDTSVYPEVSVPKKVLRPKGLPKVLVPNKKPKNFKTKDFAGQWPLDHSRFWISSKFGPRRKRDGKWGFHYGIDMAAIKGTPVYAVADGMVCEAVHSAQGYGNYIVIMHNKKYKTRYAHLDTMYVKKGQRITTGALIGRVGATGSVRGKNASHLHFEVQVFGKRINPLYILT
jgi:murein DD-endopeptidase MepM/ murein hydrolase activator NlpD